VWVFFFILFLIIIKHRFFWKARKIKNNEFYKKVFFAHRGIIKNYPENTIKAFVDAVDSGYNAIELDLVRTKDDELVCSHNFDLEIETNGSGNFKNYNLGELENIKTGVNSHPENQQPISTFRDLMIDIPNDIYLNIELKTEKWFDLKSVGILNRYRKEGIIKKNYIVSTFNPLMVLYIRYFTGLRRVGFLIMYRDWLWLTNWIHPDALHPSAELLSDDLIKYCKEKKLIINTWTVNNHAALKVCLKLDINGIITDEYKPLLIKDLKR